MEFEDSVPLYLILCHLNSVHILTPNLRSILILSSYLYLGFGTCLLPSGFPTKLLCIFLFSTVRATCPAHLLHLIILIGIIFCELRICLICSFLYPPLTSTVLYPNIFLSTVPYSHISLIYVLPLG